MLDAIGWAIIIGSGIWVFFDLWMISKQSKDPEVAKSLSPTAWAVGTILLWIVCFPLYLYKRAGYKQENFSFKSPVTIIGYLVFAAFILLAVLYSTGDIKMSTADLQVAVQENILETWKEEFDIKEIKLNSFNLFHKTGNQYEGLLDVTVDDERSKVIVEVTYDGKGFMWRVRAF